MGSSPSVHVPPPQEDTSKERERQRQLKELAKKRSLIEHKRKGRSDLVVPPGSRAEAIGLRIQ